MRGLPQRRAQPAGLRTEHGEAEGLSASPADLLGQVGEVNVSRQSQQRGGGGECGRGGGRGECARGSEEGGWASGG